VAVGNKSNFFSDRISLLVSIVLTSVAFKFAIKDSLPSLPYMTILDKWLTCLFFIFFIAAIETTIAELMINSFNVHSSFVWTMDKWAMGISVFCIGLASYVYVAKPYFRLLEADPNVFEETGGVPSPVPKHNLSAPSPRDSKCLTLPYC